jgi:uncharacterized protein (DUF362 family)
MPQHGGLIFPLIHKANSRIVRPRKRHFLSPTGLIIASKDRVAADIVGLGVIKAFGKWERVAQKDVWDQKQIRKAVELGVGKRRGEIELVTGEGDSSFSQLIRRVREETGL